MDKLVKKVGIDPRERVLVLRMRYAILIVICGFALLTSLWHQAWFSFTISFACILVFTWFLRYATRKIQKQSASRRR